MNKIRFYNLKHTILIMICLSFSLKLFAQEKGVDVLVLKTGERLRGIIIEQKPGEYVRLLQIPSNDTIKIELTAIETLIKIIDEGDQENQKNNNEETEQSNNSDIELNPDQIGFNKRAYYVNLGAFVGGGDWSNCSMGLSVVRTFSPKLQAGLGVSAIATLASKNNDKLDAILPITAEFRYTLQEMWKGRTALMLNLSTGYHAVLQGYYTVPVVGESDKLALMRNGLYFQPSLGMRVNFTKNFGLLFEVSYQYIGSKSHYDITGDFIKKHQYSSILFGTKFFF